MKPNRSNSNMSVAQRLGLGFAGVLALLYRTGDPRVQLRPGAREPAPVGVAGLVGTVAQAKAHGSGAIAVRRLNGPAGERWVVTLPGTDRWELPWQQHPDGAARDAGANLRAVGGAPTVYTRGVTQALHELGVPPGARVMLVGHSQGGLAAAELAGDAAFAADYRVTHVITVGAPIGSVPVPTGVQVLALENDCDAVPTLEGRANPDRPNIVTVRFHTAGHAVGANHAIGVYAHAAARVDASADSSVRAVVAGMTGYTDATSSMVYTATISRAVTPAAAPP